MRLVDTSAWIEWLIGSPLGVALAAELPDRAQWLVPIYATALAHGADLLTCDRHFENLPGVRFVPKTVPKTGG
jgi:predicted nucleic acid-binding protein